jgi:hypothetical protein
MHMDQHQEQEQEQDQDDGEDGLRYYTGRAADSPYPDAAQHARIHELRTAILAVVDQAKDMSQDERTIAVADALLGRETFTEGWCPACRATAEGICENHDQGSDLVDAFRRHAYKRIGVENIEV